MCSRFVRTTWPIATMSMLRMVSRMTANASCPISSPVSAFTLAYLMRWPAVDLVEADFLGIRSGRIQSDRTGNKRKAQKAFPVGAGGHFKYSKPYRTRIQDDLASLVPTINRDVPPAAHHS